MQIEEFYSKVRKIIGEELSISISYSGEWYVEVEGHWSIRYNPDDLERSYKYPKTREELQAFLKKCYNNLRHMYAKSGTNLILVYNDKEYIISKNISQYQKIKLLSENKNSSPKWTFWDYEKIKNDKEIDNKNMPWVDFEDIMSTTGSIPSVGIYHKPHDDNFYYHGKKYE